MSATDEDIDAQLEDAAEDAMDVEAKRLEDERKAREAMIERVREAAKTYQPNKLAEAYVKLRNHKQELGAELERKIADTVARMEVIGAELQSRMDAMGVTSMKTPMGTPYISATTVAQIIDYEKFAKFVVKNRKVDILQARLSTKALAEWNEKHPTNPVPGVQVSQVRNLRVKKS